MVQLFLAMERKGLCFGEQFTIFHGARWSKKRGLFMLGNDSQSLSDPISNVMYQQATLYLLGTKPSIAISLGKTEYVT